MKASSCLVALVLMSSYSAFAAIDTPSDADINKSLNDIKNTLQDNKIALPAELENVELPNVEEAKTLFKEKCNKVSGSDAAFEEAGQATTSLMDCVQSLVNISALPEEIEKAKPNGNLDTVFNKYCDKRGEAILCVDAFTKSLDPCLTQEEKEQKVVFINITKSLLEFVCHENGNQIALFIAEEGPECFKAKQDALQECFEGTMGKYFNDTMPSIENLPELIIKEENCRDMDKLEECAVHELEKCKESTPANLVEALFRFVRKETPCSKYPKKNSRSAQDNVKVSAGVVVATIFLAYSAKLMTTN